MEHIKKILKKLLKGLGYNLSREMKHRPKQIGNDLLHDISLFVKSSSPVIFDVGANVGQSIKMFKQGYPASLVHAFEPSPSTFNDLTESSKDINALTLWNYGVGSYCTTLPFLENKYSDMSSFFAPGVFGWGEVEKTTEVPVITLDQFATEQKIGFIDILKSDTQGFDLEVFRGASQLMKENRIGLIYVELTFTEIYKGIPPPYQIFKLLEENNFRLVSFYKQNYQSNVLGWTDVLFVHEDYYRKSREH